MGNFIKKIYMKGCNLVTTVAGCPTDMYQFIFNPETGDHSDISPCGNGLEFELKDDGVYRVVTLQVENATIIPDGIKIGSREYTVEEILDLINSNAYSTILNIGTYDIDDTISICNLKKCLAELEMKMYRDMLKHCGDIVCKNDEVKAQRDFLFIGVWLIEHYIEVGNIEKAQVVYNSLKGCGNLCGNLLNNKKGCGCNG